MAAEDSEPLRRMVEAYHDIVKRDQGTRYAFVAADLIRSVMGEGHRWSFTRPCGIVPRYNPRPRLRRAGNMKSDEIQALEKRLGEIDIPYTSLRLGSAGSRFGVEEGADGYLVSVTLGFPVERSRTELVESLRGAYGES